MTTDTKTRLTDLLRRKAKESPVSKAEFVKWLDNVRALHQQVRKWLGDLEGKRLVVVTEAAEDVRLVFADGLRTYQIPRLKIEAPDGSAVELRPISHRVVGAKGRVDLVRGGRLVTLLCDSQGHWSLLDERSARLRKAPLDESSFLKSLLTLLE